MSTLRVNNVTNVAGGTTYAPGHVIQVVQTFKSDNFLTNSTTFVDVPGLTVTITPKSASSKLLVMVSGITGNSSANYGTRLNLLRDGAPIAQSTNSTGANQTLQVFSQDVYATQAVAINYLDSPATTSAVTYKMQLCSFNSSSNSVWGRQPTGDSYPSSSSIIVMEVAA